ncbi:MAG: 30S ribosome-binding factor RbfA, partial [Sulfuricella sp.]|nr:30S ribosome-binding factor RbfA [Sulfuricella sp.]
TTMKSAEQATKAQAGLEHAAGFLRSQLAHRMKLRIMPQLHFIYDTSVENGVRLSQLIDEAVASDKAHQREE